MPKINKTQRFPYKFELHWGQSVPGVKTTAFCGG